MRSEVLAHHAVPTTAVLVHLRLQVTRKHAFLLVILEALTQAVGEQLFDLLDLVWVHVGCLHLCLDLALALRHYIFKYNLKSMHSGFHEREKSGDKIGCDLH